MHGLIGYLGAHNQSMDRVVTMISAESQTSRRNMLNYLLGTGAMATLAAILYPVIKFMIPPRVVESSASSVVAAKVAEIKPNGGKIFKFGSKPGILVQTPAGEYRAFSAVCTHLDCTVQYRPEEKLIWCACHNGRYDLTGKNISGPPPRPLESFLVNVRGDEIVVSRG
jgi:cytochrome b6-f complex iron-sulfur subunit